MMKMFFCSILILFLLTHPASAAFELKQCVSILYMPSKNIENLKSKLPKFSVQADTYFSSHYKGMGLPRFYRLKNRPQYYLWLLHHNLDEEINELNFHLEEKGEFDANTRIGFISVLFLYSSNLRNSWTEYAAYSADSSFSDDEKDRISAEMMSLIGSIHVYFGCLQANMTMEEK